MQIDWVTVAAQIVNFLVLVWLLHRVLYRPLTRALKAREEEVQRSLRDAEAARETAEIEAEAHRVAVRELEDTRLARLAAAEEEAVAQRAEITKMARGELAERRAAWQAQLEDEKAAFLDRLRRRAGEAFVTLARRALADMADEDLVDRIAHVFARRLSALDPEEQEHLKSAAGGEDAPLVLSSFPSRPRRGRWLPKRSGVCWSARWTSTFARNLAWNVASCSQSAHAMSAGPLANISMRSKTMSLACLTPARTQGTRYDIKGGRRDALR